MIRVPASWRRASLTGGLATAITIGLWAAPAAADPSFDCSAATIPAETAICAEPELAKLDQQIATVYFALLESARPTLAAQIRHQQRAFLRERNGCTAGDAPLAVCLDAIMRERLAALQQLHMEHNGAPLVSGGDVISAPGVIWQATRPGDILDNAFRTADGQVLCAVGLPERPVIGTTTDTGSSGCAIARDGAGASEPAFSILAAAADAFAWAPVMSVTRSPDGAVDVWRDGADAVQVCRATVDGQTMLGTFNAGDACAVLVGSDATADEVLMLAGFDVLTRPE